MYKKDLQYYKFCFYGFLKNLRFFEPFFILYLRSKGISFTDIGILYAVREIVTNLLEIPSGLFADSVGRKKSLLMAYVFYIFSFVIFALSNNFWLFLVAIVSYGAGDAFRSGTHKAMIYKYLEIKGWSEYKVDYYGHTRSCSQIGSAISSLAAAVFVFFTGNYVSVYYYTIVPYVLGFLLIASYPSWLDVRGKGKVRESFVQVWKHFWQALKNWQTLRVLTNLSLLEAWFKSVKDYIQPIIKQLALLVPIAFLAKYSDKQKITFFIGLVYFVLYLMTSYASRNSAKLLKSNKKLGFWVNGLLIAGIIVSTLAGLFSAMKLPVYAVLLFMLVYIIHNFRKPMSVALLSRYFTNKVFASGLSTQNQFKTVLTAIISFLIGFLSDKVGVGYAIMIVGGILLVLSLLVRVKEN